MSLFQQMREDARAALERDPAAGGMLDVVLFSVGTHAVWSYRWHHWLYERGWRHLALWLAKRTRVRLGVDIHPAARIGRRFTIDHGIGVVIGSTAVIGDDVLLYQGVTLGMTGTSYDAHGKRHPTIGSDVLVGAGAIVLGDITVGDGSRLAAGAVVVRDVPAHSTVAGVPARIVRDRGATDLHLVEDPGEEPLSEYVRWSCAL